MCCVCVHTCVAANTLALVTGTPPFSDACAGMKARLALLLALGALLAAAATGEPGLPTVAICVAIKDQNVDVREWIIYHRAIGRPRFQAGSVGNRAWHLL